jgi:hypothetical protein
MNIQGDAMQRVSHRARRVRRWTGSLERLEDRLVLSSATADATVLLNQSGKVSKRHVAAYPITVNVASFITVNVSNLPRADRVKIESGGTPIRVQAGSANFTIMLQPGAYTVVVQGKKKGHFEISLSSASVNPAAAPANPGPAAPTTVNLSVGAYNPPGLSTARTVYVQVAFLGRDAAGGPSGESARSAEQSINVGVGQTLDVTWAYAGTDAFANVYAGYTSGSEVLQNATPIPITQPWLMPSTGLIIGVNQFASALVSAINKATNQFALDATAVEAVAPTLAYNAIKPELAQVDSDAINGNIIKGYQDIQTLGQTMFQEAAVVVAERLPGTDALLGYSQLINDLLNLAILKEITYAFLVYEASRVPTQYTGSTPQYLTTGLLGGSSGGAANPTSQPLLNNLSQPDLEAANNYFNSQLSGGLDPGSPLDPTNDDFNYSNSDSSSYTAGDGDQVIGTLGSFDY